MHEATISFLNECARELDRGKDPARVAKRLRAHALRLQADALDADAGDIPPAEPEDEDEDEHESEPGDEGEILRGASLASLSEGDRVIVVESSDDHIDGCVGRIAKIEKIFPAHVRVRIPDDQGPLRDGERFASAVRRI